MQIEIIGPVLQAPYIIQIHISGFNQQPITMYLLFPEAFPEFKRDAPVFVNSTQDAWLLPKVSIAYAVLKDVKKSFYDYYSHEYTAKFSLMSYSSVAESNRLITDR